MQFSFSVSDLVEICAPERVEGSTDEAVRGIASLKQAGPGDLSFLGNPRYKSAVPESRASVILVPSAFAGSPASGQVFLRVENPSAALARVCARLEVALWPRPAPGVHPNAVVDAGALVAAGAVVGPLCVVESGAVIGARTWLEAGVYIGRGARLGADCRLSPGVRVLAECELRDRVRLHSGVVVGSDGFGYETIGGKHEKLPQVGNVVVHSDVEIGANSTIDRARFSATIIGEGTKIDNLVQIGHNVVIGRHCIICAQVGVAGSTTIEDYVVAGGQAGFSGHITIGRTSMIGGRTAIFSDVPAGSRLKGDPAIDLRLAHRVDALKKRLPEFFRRLESIEAHLEIARPPGDSSE